MAELLQLKPQDYTITWLCALPKSELVAATMMLDERHEELRLNPQDKNIYTYGSINGHNVVLACLPPGQPNKLSGLKLVQPLRQSFPNLRIHLFVGIGGGVPRDPPPEDPRLDIHLGDVAVGWAEKIGDPGVMQWDYVRYHGQDKVKSLGSLNKPDWQLMAALGSMLRDREMGEKPFYTHLTGLNERTSKFAHPGQDNDRLFRWTYTHVDNDIHSIPCHKCNPSQLAKRSPRTTLEPVFHQGTIASGDSVMQNAERRDVISRRFHNAICSIWRRLE
ncbi:MAG: hypothetical protein ALECFALPRED_005902 [Alectoria fallacina]|uniref:Nucleoside phosphorylase domain-containing protein n=1 Tax=Alectoria fallacina TaxID=1903189 RepID=A0A8H3G110_9LECA|nr:MAG: hypothetical protein ALECFALPRED_005902 [Alectoria fallacina]